MVLQYLYTSHRGSVHLRPFTGVIKKSRGVDEGHVLCRKRFSVSSTPAWGSPRLPFPVCLRTSSRFLPETRLCAAAVTPGPFGLKQIRLSLSEYLNLDQLGACSGPSCFPVFSPPLGLLTSLPVLAGFGVFVPLLPVKQKPDVSSCSCR